VYLQGYTNVDNPFGDEHLTETFVWSKKISKEGKEALAHEEIHQMTKKKMEENRVCFVTVFYLDKFRWNQFYFSVIYILSYVLKRIE
jgi:hypothetical protein